VKHKPATVEELPVLEGVTPRVGLARIGNKGGLIIIGSTVGSMSDYGL
jgi:hypothetical protein